MSMRLNRAPITFTTFTACMSSVAAAPQRDARQLETERTAFSREAQLCQVDALSGGAGSRRYARRVWRQRGSWPHVFVPTSNSERNTTGSPLSQVDVQATTGRSSVRRAGRHGAPVQAELEATILAGRISCRNANHITYQIVACQ